MAEIEESGFKRMFPQGDVRVFDRRPRSEIIWASHFAFILSPDEADIRVLKDRYHGGNNTSVEKTLKHLRENQDRHYRIVFFTERSPFRAGPNAPILNEVMNEGFQPGETLTLFGATSRGRTAVRPNLEHLFRPRR